MQAKLTISGLAAMALAGAVTSAAAQVVEAPLRSIEPPWRPPPAVQGTDRSLAVPAPRMIPVVDPIRDCVLPPVVRVRRPHPVEDALKPPDVMGPVPPPVVELTNPPGRSALPNDLPANFVRQAWQRGLFIQAASRLAVEKADHEQIRRLALRFAREYDQILEDLAVVARCVGAELPEGLSPGQEDALAALRNATGPIFDYRYIRAQVEAHEQAVFAYEQQVQKEDNLTLRRFVRAYLPVLKTHMRHSLSLSAGLSPIAGKEVHGGTRYFDRHGMLGWPLSRGLPSMNIEGPSPGQIPVMPSNRQPATTAPYHQPPAEQRLRGGPGLAPEPAPPAAEMSQQTIPTKPDRPFIAGIPDSRRGGVEFVPGLAPDAVGGFRGDPAILRGRPVVTSVGEEVGEVERVIRHQGLSPQAAQLVIGVERPFALGERQVAVDLADVAVRADGAVIITPEQLAGRGGATPLERPPTPPPVPDDAPPYAIAPPPKAGGS